MEKSEKLKDGTPIVIRSMKQDDLEGLVKFFAELPDEDRVYLRKDVTKREIVERGVQAALSDEVIRLVASADGGIVADGRLEIDSPGWTEDVAEFRLIVSRPYQHRGVGMLLARELFLAGARRKVEKITARFLKPQVAAMKIMKRLGFREEHVLRGLAKDLKGTQQDMIVMTCDLERIFTELEEFFQDGDWKGSVLSGV
jgi:RimJ/RimL family protein N-acetyltransferase